MANIKTVFTADTAPFKRGLSGIKDDAGKLKGLLATLGVGLSVAGIAAFAKEVADLGEQFKEISEATGIAQDKLQTIVTMGELGGGLKLESMTKNILKMTEYLQDAADPTSKAAEGIEKLGLSVAELTSMDAASQYHKINTAVAGLSDSQERLVLLSKIYGKTGKDLAPMLSSGADGYMAQMVQADKYIKLTSKSTAACDEFNDQLHVFSQSILKAGGEVMSPAFTEFAKMLETLSIRIGNLQRDGTLAVWSRQLGSAMEGARRLIENLFTEKNIKGFVSALGQIATVLKTIWNSLGNSPFEKLFNLVLLRQSSNILTGVIGKAAENGIELAKKKIAAGSDSMFAGLASRANIWIAIIAGAYMAGRAIKALEQSWNDVNAAAGRARMDATLAEYDKLNDKISANKRLLEDAQSAEKRTKDNANNMLEKEIGMLEEQAGLLAKLKGLRDDEQKKAEDAQDAINKGKEKEAELTAQLADAEREQSAAELDSQIAAQDAIIDKYKAEFDGLDKVSAARLRDAAQGKGITQETQAEFVHKARMAVAARNLSAGINDPRYAAETTELAQREQMRRAAVAKKKELEAQKKAMEPDHAQVARDKQQKIKGELLKNTEEIGDNAVKKANADRKASYYGGQLTDREKEFRSAGAMLQKWAETLGNTDAQERLVKLAASLADGNVKLGKETDIFEKLLGNVAKAIQFHNAAIYDAENLTIGAQGRNTEENPKYEELKKKLLEASGSRAINDWESSTGQKLPDAEKAKVKQDKYAQQLLEWRLESAKAKSKMGWDGKIKWNSNKLQEDTDYYNRQMQGVKVPSAVPNQTSTGKYAQNGTSADLKEINKNIQELNNNATVVKADDGRGGAR
jgi:hypothetical protein